MQGLLQLVLPRASAWSLQSQVLWQAVLPVMLQFKPIIFQSLSESDADRKVDSQNILCEVYA